MGMKELPSRVELNSNETDLESDHFIRKMALVSPNLELCTNYYP